LPHFRVQSSASLYMSSDSNSYELCLAHYGHVQLPGAKHWALILLTEPKCLKGIAYQVSGSTTTYAVKKPEEVFLLSAQTYMGRVRVGSVTKSRAFGDGPDTFHSTVMSTPCVRDRKDWHCQHWVVQVIMRLYNARFNVQPRSIDQLLFDLGRARREDLP
ncbi:hypothetical protein AMATHDRAFT_139864, partial [Amanita thiersii Skay4041]